MVMCCLKTETCSEKCVAGQFQHCANTIACTNTLLDGIIYLTVGCVVQLVTPRPHICTTHYCAGSLREL